MARVEGKTAIVTGGAGGIGATTAALLAQEGANVVVADLDGARAEDVAHRIGNRVIAIQYDAEDPVSIDALIAKTASHFGAIDILHNNAAFTANIMEIDTTLLDTSLETFDKTIRINLRSMFIASKAVVPHMLKRGGGSIINMGTSGAVRGFPRLIAYSTSKGGISTFTRYLAVQYGRQNIRANCILPGVIMTDAAKSAWKVSGVGKSVIPTLPFHRDGQPADVAALVLFLSSDEAQFMNGELIACDGGLLAGEAFPEAQDERQ